MYALNLNEEARVLSATLEQYAPAEYPKVEELPEGDITDYKFIEDEFVYDPIPEPEPPEPTPSVQEQLNKNRADIDFIAMCSDIDLDD